MGRTEHSPSLEGLIAQNQVEAWILCLPESAVSPHSTFLRLDWRFRGALARAVNSGALSKKSGEISLIPYTRPVSDLGPDTFRVLTVGVHDRKNVSSAEVAALSKNLRGLRLKKFGLSASDFGWTIAEAKKHFSGADACIVE